MDSNASARWKVTNSKHIVKDRWISVRADDCITSDGQELKPYYVLEYDEWINCLVIDNDGQVTLLKHYRYAVDDVVLEVVGGKTEGEDVMVTVARELEEELGLVNADIHQLGAFYANPATQTNKVHAFVAIGGTFDGRTLDEAGAEFEIVRMPLRELLEKVNSQAHTFQGFTLACLFLANNLLKEKGLLPQ